MNIDAVTIGQNVFPAPAGVILVTDGDAAAKDGFPRTCGGDPENDAEEKYNIMFSPHLRG